MLWLGVVTAMALAFVLGVLVGDGIEVWPAEFDAAGEAAGAVNR